MCFALDMRPQWLVEMTWTVYKPNGAKRGDKKKNAAHTHTFDALMSPSHRIHIIIFACMNMRGEVRQEPMFVCHYKMPKHWHCRCDAPKNQMASKMCWMNNLFNWLAMKRLDCVLPIMYEVFSHLPIIRVTCQTTQNMCTFRCHRIYAAWIIWLPPNMAIQYNHIQSWCVKYLHQLNFHWSCLQVFTILQWANKWK